MLKYFNYSEFDSPDVQGSGQLMDKNFLSMLDEIREIVGEPLIINSGFRTPQHNESLPDSKPDSSHLKGVAADIAVRNSRMRFKLLEAIHQVGISRIGIGKHFIHIDIDKDKHKKVIWTY